MTTSSRREALVELAERCEAASGADRELDCRIWAAIGNGDFRVMRAVVPDLTQWASVRAYTTSLDAAMSLVDGVGVLLHLSDIGADGLPLAVIGDPGEGQEFKGVGARTLALCVTAAALRAIAATGAA